MNFYDSIIEGAQFLPATVRGQVYTAVLEYLYYEREPNFKMADAAMALFVSFKPNLDNQIAKQKAGAKGGKARAKRQADAKQGASKDQAEGKQPAKQNATEQEQEQEVKELANASSKRRARFVPPTPEEVDEYIREKGYTGFDGEGFCAFYASKGWKVGNQPMRDWKRACVTWWKRREAEQKTTGGASDGFDDFKI